ncbi:MAG: metal-dependent hydrolase [Euryarchaeota archaeon]|nr:metal-dependent hydrolase [Euryarchaeota archaeon]
MQRSTHIAAVFFIWSLSYFYYKISFTFALVAALGAYLPDLVYFRHRKYLHNVWVLIGLSLLVLYFSDEFVAIIFGLSYFLHLLLDAVTRVGVDLFWPIKFFTFGGPLRGGSIFDDVILLAFVYGGIYFFIKILI